MSQVFKSSDAALLSERKMAAARSTPRAWSNSVSFVAWLCVTTLAWRLELVGNICVWASVTLCVEPSPSLQEFLEPLPVLPSIDVSTGRQITLGAFKISQSLHRHLPNTTLYAYGESQETASFPGPTLIARRGIPANIRWENHIPDERHMLEIDDAIHWAKPRRGGVPIVTHLHGGEVESASDGHPDAWFTTRAETGPSFVTQNYTYANSQPPAALWYHDHTIGITRVNVMAGLSGFYILRESAVEKEKMSLPEPGILLFFKDLRFFANGSIHFRVHGSSAGDAGWCPEYGDTMLVNGKVWPYLQVYPGAYRFRMLNGCNARFLDLSLTNSTLSFLQIGTDSGFLEEPQSLTSLLMSPGERVDVLIDFTGLQNGTEVLLSNSAPSPFPYADSPYFAIGTADVMKFIVVNEGGTVEGLLDDDEHTPASLLFQSGERASAPSAHATPGSALSRIMYPEVDVMRSFNLTRHSPTDAKPPANRIGDGKWEDPVDQFSVPGNTELWEIINVSEDAHNMQIHLVQFQMLSQQSFAMEDYEAGTCSIQVQYPEAGSCFTEEARGPEAYQQGWKDTIIMWPSNVTVVLLRFASRDREAGAAPFPFDPTAGPGYVWNSATPDHEDFEMLKRFQLAYSESADR